MPRDLTHLFAKTRRVEHPELGVVLVREATMEDYLRAWLSDRCSIPSRKEPVCRASASPEFCGGSGNSQPGLTGILTRILSGKFDCLIMLPSP